MNPLGVGSAGFFSVGATVVGQDYDCRLGASRSLKLVSHCVDDEIIAPLGSKPFLTFDIACVTLWKMFAP
jgi:hypothetical protein